MGLSSGMVSDNPQQDTAESLRQRLTQTFSEKIIESALGEIALYLYNNGVSVTLITVGGIVDMKHLKSWQTMNEGILFGNDISVKHTRTLVKEARDIVVAKSPVMLGTEWFNVENYFWLAPKLCHELTAEAVAQDIVVYDNPGLKILAAPWEHAFAVKVSRLLGNQEGANQRAYYELHDSVQYLKEILKKKGHARISLAVVMSWSSKFGLRTCREYLIDVVDQEYWRQFGQNAMF
ncbi:hypothetical protein EJ05DRAFT_524799 [Pseudovirgaria hyperparasitica]|uniref:Uncharacterized protein n=1 Tax=Pseudovirgaria hyperparasitica TaxID=470096 RepID=A0A6A6WHA6_9PEZI|nr:uncharacterized protein EJ05DRAFT_524799 [Pseudovirgaria hyperparasitica]KAF2761464.1 hypothetical protein EJ05DRAFT_524799 [Pseudovirgaria hyperparasitica]